MSAMSCPRHRAVAVICSLLMLLLSLVGVAACNLGATSTAATKTTATADPQLQSYLSELTTYYKPMGSDITSDWSWETNQLHPTGVQPDQAAAVQLMNAERPIEVQIESEAQALRDHLTVTPPTQLQADDTYLRQAAKATAVIYTKLVALIDAHNVQGFIQTYESEEEGNLYQYCGPIGHVNSQLVAVKQPLSALLPQQFCYDGFISPATPTP